jgi:rubrerythrin
MEEKSLMDLIDTAITREEEAYDFYMELFEKTENAGAKDTLNWIAGEEKKHRDFLAAYRKGEYRAENPSERDVKYYKIAEYQNEPEQQADMKIEEIYLMAAHRELRSHKFYSELADMHVAGSARDMLQKMATEELKHKEKLEYLYANTAFPQTAGG